MGRGDFIPVDDEVKAEILFGQSTSADRIRAVSG